MQHHRVPRLLVSTVGACAGLALAVPDLASSARAVTGLDLADALAGVAVLALATLSLWLLVASALVGLALRTGTGVALARRLAPAWLAANRAVIGPDPDVLHPGQVLTVPAEGPVAP